VLKRFFTFIIHDFGTGTRDELTRVALRQMHMLGVLTHTGIATTEMVGKTMEMLHRRYPSLWLNTTVIFNLSSQPSKETLKAIAREKADLSRAGGEPGWLRRTITRILRKDLQSEDADIQEIQTPGQALRVINKFIGRRKLVGPLLLPEIVLVGYDEHLHQESRLDFDKVSPTVQGQFYTVFHRILSTRWNYEKDFKEHHKDVKNIKNIRREQMRVRIVGTGTYDKELVYEIAPLSAPPVIPETAPSAVTNP
jgi:hypothetical protein